MKRLQWLESPCHNCLGLGAEGLSKAGPETVLHMSLGPLILINAGWIDSDTNVYSSRVRKESGVQ